MTRRAPFKKYFANIGGLYPTEVLAHSLREARKEVRERWFSDRKRLPDYVYVWEATPAAEKTVNCAAATDFAYDLAMNDGGARLRQVEAHCNR